MLEPLSSDCMLRLNRGAPLECRHSAPGIDCVLCGSYCVVAVLCVRVNSGWFYPAWDFRVCSKCGTTGNARQWQSIGLSLECWHN